ncbi:MULTISPECIES: dihydrofolate reductase [Alteribacter]|uniref:Dihydrofolate reductase n=1 Tax=Alteribacter keqinensis TaxID=2483800 RepID=A0A3M7TPP9_9BACI|nr:MULTISPECIES: dihydrofolate reductase [Alteribacter]MBM7096997.1 dihydrofolate reductase [Alteribacter salitolerans]RNA67425.1 dihydrofolate reductase [Alteribacter keqinensis]
MISLIAAMDENNVIGHENKLPWSLPNDLAHFKRITSGHTVVMGRNTFVSIGRPLPDRRNIVVTSNPDFYHDGIEVVDSLAVVDDLAQKEEVMVLGGQKVFEQLMDKADRLYVTRIHHTFQGDTYFPPFSEQNWDITEKLEGKMDSENKYAHTFFVYDRKR